MGHSLGVLTAIDYLINFSDKIAGGAFFSAGRTPHKGVYKPTPKKTVVNEVICSFLKPSKPTLKYYRDRITGLDEPLFNFKYTLKFLTVLYAKKIPLPTKITVPIYFAIGDQDEIFTVETAKAFFEEIPAKDKTFYVIPNGHHADLTPNIVSDLNNWLKNKFSN